MEKIQSDTLMQLPEIIKLIREISDPEQIILFGSYARGNFRDDSDLDLLVIKEVVSSPGEELDRIYLGLRHLLIPVDVILVSRAYVERYRDVIGTVVYPALREGKILYAR